MKKKKLIYIALSLLFVFLVTYNSNSIEKSTNNSFIASTDFKIMDSELESKDEKNKNLDKKELLFSNYYNRKKYELINKEKIFHLEKIEEDKKKSDFHDKIKTHTVKKGETLWSIADKYDINIDTLIGANDISNMNEIQPGEEIDILPVKGILYNIGPGENLESIAKKFDINKKKIIEYNNIEDEDNVEKGKTLLLAGAVPEFSYKDRLEQMFIPPVNSRISSYYGERWGRMHEGIDYAVSIGTPIKAAASGRVTYSDKANGYGLVVIIQHQKGLKTLYAHNSKLLVSNGDYVRRGEIIAKSGNTGNSTGPHLHFEVQVNGRPANPLNYLRNN
ncbi:MAG: peptidoglycan DD-metalloendopeptidase family protein [Bacillota bacterium]